MHTEEQVDKIFSYVKNTVYQRLKQVVKSHHCSIGNAAEQKKRIESFKELITKETVFFLPTVLGLGFFNEIVLGIECLPFMQSSLFDIFKHEETSGLEIFLLTNGEFDTTNIDRRLLRFHPNDDGDEDIDGTKIIKFYKIKEVRGRGRPNTYFTSLLYYFIFVKKHKQQFAELMKQNDCSLQDLELFLDLDIDKVYTKVIADEKKRKRVVEECLNS